MRSSIRNNGLVIIIVLTALADFIKELFEWPINRRHTLNTLKIGSLWRQDWHHTAPFRTISFVPVHRPRSKKDKNLGLRSRLC